MLRTGGASRTFEAHRKQKSLLEARGITFAYEKANPVLQDFSLAMKPGERVFLQAPSGRGKTTLCRLIAGYLPLQQGEVLVDGAPLSLRGTCPVQLIGQHPERMLDSHLRMADSLGEAGVDGFDAATELLFERLGICHEWLNRYPHELSGGELQRFCIARALAARPRYLVADEVSTMLDALTQAQIWRVLADEAEAREMGILFTTHSEALAQRVATRMVPLPPLEYVRSMRS